MRSLVVLRKVAIVATAAGRESAPKAMTVRLGQQEKGIAFLLHELAARDLVIRERDEGIEWLRRVVHDKELAIAELEKGVAWLRNEVAARDGIIQALRQDDVPAPEVATAQPSASPRAK